MKAGKSIETFYNCFISLKGECRMYPGGWVTVSVPVWMELMTRTPSCPMYPFLLSSGLTFGGWHESGSLSILIWEGSCLLPPGFLLQHLKLQAHLTQNMWTTTASQLWFRAKELALLGGEITGTEALMKFLRKKTLCCVCVSLTFLFPSRLAPHRMWVGCSWGPRDWRKVVELEAYQRLYTKPERRPLNLGKFSKEKFSAFNGIRRLGEEATSACYRKQHLVCIHGIHYIIKRLILQLWVTVWLM